eukprot:198666_1
MSKGAYFIGISPSNRYPYDGGSYQFKIDCVKIVDKNSTSVLSISNSTHNDTHTAVTNDCHHHPISFDNLTYILMVHYQLYSQINWYALENRCEAEFGTALATIISEKDLKTAVTDINDILNDKGWAKEQRTNFNIHIGLISDLINGGKWKWVDGTKCDYTPTGDCSDDIHWHKNQPDGEPVLALPEQFTAVLYIPDVSTNVNATFYDDPLDDRSNDHTSLEGGIAVFYLCNGPKSQYSVQGCTQKSCWINKQYLDDDYVREDSIPTYIKPIVAYWKSKLFIIGTNQMHYTPMKLFYNDFEWNHKTHNFSIDWSLEGYMYTQYQSTIYFYAFQCEFGYKNCFVKIDLDSLELQLIHVPDQYPANVQCIVADENSVYLVGPSSIYKYTADDWTISILDTGVSTRICAITYDEKYIYMFDYPIIIKYDINFGSFKILQTTNICMFQQGTANNDHDVRTVTGINGKIYFHGCYFAGWKTLIFDPKMEQFENETIDITEPTKGDMPYYRFSYPIVFDDNILLLLYRNAQSFLVHSAVTDLVSINFSNTNMLPEIWPSDGFDIKYYLNDFSNLTNNIYYIFLYSNNTMKSINTSIILNPANDDCICTNNIYNCYNCCQHFELNNFLTVYDNNVAQLTFIPTYSIVKNTNVHPLIVQKYITIKLQRCNISFKNITTFITSDNPSIKFNFTLSPNCYSRIGTNFSLNITAPKIYIAKELLIIIMHDDLSHENKTLCKICEMERESDNDCLNIVDESFVIHGATNFNGADFKIDMKSNMIDFRITSSTSKIIKYYGNRNTTQFNNDLWYLLLLLIIPCIVIFIVFLYCKRAYMDAFVVDKSLVLIIGICQFDDKKLLLAGVKYNIIDLIDLWRYVYNYDVFVCNQDTLYCTKLDVIDFIDEHMTKLEDTTYKAVIVHVISHGSDDSFVTSDSKQLNIDFIKHELINKADEEENIGLIKLIFNHGCQGEANYSDGNIMGLNTYHTTNNEQIDDNLYYATRGALNMHRTIDNNHDYDIPHDANCAVIAGNISGRTMSDSGYFTKCICDAFKSNLKRMIKADFNSLMVEIGRNLENKTNNAELSNVNGTLRYHHIRFEKGKNINNDVDYNNKSENNNDIQMFQLNKDKNTNDDYILLAD